MLRAKAARQTQASIEQIALHEAGHAVVAIACGCIVAYATVTEDGGVTFCAQATRSGREDPIIQGIIAWAGSVAEGVDHIGEDDAAAFERFGFTHRSIVTLRHHALALVHEHRRAIRAVARELVRRRMLHGRTIKALALRASPRLRREAVPFHREAIRAMLAQAPPLDLVLKGKLTRGRPIRVQVRRPR